MATSDATVTASDLRKVSAEVTRVPLDQTSNRLRELEPVIIEYIETAADRAAGRLVGNGAKAEDARYAAAEIRKISFTVMRAINTGYHRLWANAFAPEPPMEEEKK